MITKLRARATYANVMATIALFLALGGTGYALSLPRNSVGTAQLKKGAVTAKKIRRAAVSTVKVKNRSLKAVDLKKGQLLVWRGQWQSTVAYPKNSVVQRSGSSLVATRAIPAGAPPTDESGWRILAAQGPPGEQGPPGDEGPPGEDGTFSTSGFHEHTACVNLVSSALSILGHGAKASCNAATEVAITIVVKDH